MIAKQKSPRKVARKMVHFRLEVFAADELADVDMMLVWSFAPQMFNDTRNCFLVVGN